MTDPDPLPPAGKDRPDPPSFGRALAPGMGVNLLVAEVERAARFQAAVLGAAVRYHEADFAIMEYRGTLWMLHSDRSYRDHPLSGISTGAGTARGAGVELRLYGCDPDEAEARTEAAGGIVLAGSADKPHGLREAYLIDPEGYVWVPSVPSAG